MAKRPYVSHRGMGCTDNQFYQDNRPGVNDLPVENTIKSFIAAYKEGASAFETDVCLSADGVPFVIHNVVPGDHFFGKNIPPEKLNKMTWAEIRQYATGRNGQGQVASLQEVLDVVADHYDGEFPYAVNLELKHLAGSKQDYEDNNFIRIVADTVRASRVPADKVLYSSFCAKLVLDMSHEAPESQFAFLQREYKDGDNVDPPKIGVYTDHQDDPLYQYLPFNRNTVDMLTQIWDEQAHPDAKLSYMHPEIRTVSAEMLDLMQEKKLGLNVWGLFEGPNDWIDLYRETAKMADARQVHFVCINDYAEKMNKLAA